jgi:hypothetical protein
MMLGSKKGATFYLQSLCLLVILVLGMYLRLATALQTQVDHPVRNDAKDYVSYAWNLKTYGTYSLDISTLLNTSADAPKPDATRPPGFPFLLRILMGDKVDASFLARVALTQAWIAGITLLVSTLLAMEVLGAWAGLFVGVLVAVSPHQIIYVPYLLTETLYSATLMLALGTGVLSLKARKTRSRYFWAIASGMLFAVSCLVRPTTNQWVLILLLLLLVPSVRRFKQEIAVLALGFALVMSPWWTRNEISLHRISDSSKMLETVQQGSYPDFMYDGRHDTFGYPYSADSGAANAESSWRNVFADLKAKFTQRPIAMVEWYSIGKVANFFAWREQQGWADMFEYPVLHSPWLTNEFFIILTSVVWGIYVPLIVCGVLGTFIAFLPATRILFGQFRADAIRFVALLHLFVIGVHVIGAPFARYSVPFRPITFLLAIFLFAWLFRSYMGSKKMAPVNVANG